MKEIMVMNQRLANDIMDCLVGLYFSAKGLIPLYTSDEMPDIPEEEIQAAEDYARAKYIELSEEWETKENKIWDVVSDQDARLPPS